MTGTPSSAQGHDQRHEQGHDPDLMAPHEVAEIFRVSPATITRWARVGLLPCTLTPGGHRRFERRYVIAHVERLLRETEN